MCDFLDYALGKTSIEELLNMCQKRDIHIKENTPKEEIIEIERIVFLAVLLFALLIHQDK